MEQNDVRIHKQYSASSKPELLCYLKNQDITVPSRIRRTKRQCERWGVFRLLATWATSDYLSYPIRLIHRDKPDFLLSYGNHEVGIEFTEGVSEEWAATDALAEKEGAKPLLFMDHFKRGTPKRTAQERRKLIKEKPHGGGFVDDEAKSEWALSISDRIRAKTEDFNKRDFRKYDVNVLLVYDNLCLPNFDTETSIKFLMEHMSDYWQLPSRYDRIFVDTANELIEICSGVWNRQSIVDLWTHPTS